MSQHGYIQVYTGNGKGKTTAALGLALRSVGHGRRVFIGQFMKGMHYGELTALSRIPLVEVVQFGDAVCIRKEEVTEHHRSMARQGLAAIEAVFEQQAHDLVIMDEICVTLWFEMVTVQSVLSVMDKRPPGVELVLTGRYAPDAVIDRADLVTEMKEIKHYFSDGVMARNGIER